VIYAVHSVLLG